MAIADEARKPQHFKEDVKVKKKKKSFSEAFIPHRGDSKKEIASKIFSLCALAVLIACIAILAVYFYQQFEAKQNNKNINIIYNSAVQSSSADAGSQDVSSAAGDSEEIVRQPLVVTEAAEKMLEINSDYVGYVYIPDVFSEAVVQTTDNEYYLKHNFYDQTRSCGTIFADFRNNVSDYADLQSDNIILYGHNQRDGTMFGNMDYYKWDYKYWLKNPFIYFDNIYESSVYVIVSSFVVNTEPESDDGNVFDYNNYINFKEDGDYTFEKFKKEITERSHFITGIDIDENDKFLTLSTCSYEWDDSRHVIVARKLRDGETTENIDTTQFTVNSNPKWPAIYYKYNGGSYVEE
jgi:SrtB family sortase